MVVDVDDVVFGQQLVPLGAHSEEAVLEGEDLSVHFGDLEVETVRLRDLGVEDGVDVVLTAFQEFGP